jgi:hypothetical protein
VLLRSIIFCVTYAVADINRKDYLFNVVTCRNSGWENFQGFGTPFPRISILVNVQAGTSILLLSYFKLKLNQYSCHYVL